MKGFKMSLEVAEEFFIRCADRQAKTEEDRLKILTELVHEYDVKILKEQQLVAMFANKKILHIKKEPIK